MLDIAEKNIGKNAADSLVKRLFDLSFSITLIPLTFPIVVLGIIWVVIFSPGSPLFFQRRYGMHGTPFNIIKIRTMRNTPITGNNFTSQNDNRIIFGGHFLRTTRIDELPQLLNVVLGHMSLVGPRPEQFDLAKKYEESIKIYRHRHSVRPGITGLAQIKIGYVDDEFGTKRKALLDFHYVRNWSLCLDIKICLETLRVIVQRKGAR